MSRWLDLSIFLKAQEKIINDSSGNRAVFQPQLNELNPIYFIGLNQLSTQVSPNGKTLFEENDSLNDDDLIPNEDLEL